MSKSEAIAERRPAYLADLAEGTDRFFDERSETCPWCGSGKLDTRLRTTDILQHKPGAFVLDSCNDCGHIFQNPRLNDDGLEFYYRDCYDGLGAEGMNAAFDSNHAEYQERVDMVTAVTTPKQWLDVGTGHGHFPHDAKKNLPGTEFDGLDMTDGVTLAKQEGRIREAYSGNFVELADQLASRYDVISMYHYLEHTKEPAKELAAAFAALPVDGYLAIELPDPECVLNRVVGRWWFPWLQPQHLNMIPIANLRDKLTELGFTIVDEQRVEPHAIKDALGSALLLLHAATINGEDLAWRTASPTRGRQLLRTTVFVASIPFFAVAKLLDRAIAPIGRRHPEFSNAYRVLARKPC